MGTARRHEGADRVAAFLTGDDEAVARIETTVRRGLGNFRAVFAHELDDLVQEILLELTVALRDGRYDGRGPLGAYVTRLARFHAIDRWRKRRLRTQVAIEDLDLPSTEDSPARAVASADRLRQLLRLFAAMPEDCRRLWRMIVRGMSYKQMSREVDVSEGALRVRVLRCRRKAMARAEKGGFDV